jgi:predicted DsbA family dithiol-disulfide isomerase
MKTIAEGAGVSLSFEGEGEAPPAMMWNTRDCHKLLAFALEQAGAAVQTQLKLALFAAHFNQRRNLSDRAVLLDIAAAAGLHREAAKAALHDPRRASTRGLRQRAKAGGSKKPGSALTLPGPCQAIGALAYIVQRSPRNTDRPTGLVG